MKLVADPGAVERLLGFAPRERFLMPNTALDARHVIYPPLIIEGERGFMLLEEIERGSVPAAALPPAITPAYYAPYFRWDPAERSKIPLSVLSRTPIVHTLHTRVTVDDEWVFRRYPAVPVVAVSHSQVASLGDKSAGVAR